MQNVEKAYFPALTGVRAMAAYMVFVHHFTPIQSASKSENFDWFFGEFHIGVTFFFVLSGFLIHYRYSDFGSFTWLTYWKYLISRISRIMPVFILLTTMTMVYNFYFHEQDLGLYGKNIGIFLLNISLLKGFFSDLKFSGIAQSWSLTVEFCFYFVAPILFWKIKNVFLYPLVSMFFLALGFILIFTFSYYSLQSLIDNIQFMWTYTFFGRSFEFFCGCFISFNYNKWSTIKTKNGFFTYTGLFLIILLIISLYLGKNSLLYWVNSSSGIIINNYFLPLVIILFFRGLLFENTVVLRILSSKIGQLLGKSAYVFYLIHVGVIEVGLYHFVTHNTWVLFILLNLISVVIFLLVEEPLNRLAKHYLLKTIKTS